MTCEMTPGKKFNGPLFIVGMPRSGTKLLRSLLCQHSCIEIAKIETEFLPYWISSWSNFGDLEKFENFLGFYEFVIKAPYFIYLKESGKLIDANKWFQSCEGFSPAQVFEALIRHDAHINNQSEVIWGDKSPLYIWELELLKKHFPEARFVHVIRDAQDYCISIKKAWGKNMFRAAQRWVDGVKAARATGQQFTTDYLEVHYENLLDSPEKELREICRFLDVPFEPEMLELTRPTESLGDAKGEAVIIKGNYGKFLDQLSPKDLVKIEALAGETLQDFGYQVKNKAQGKRIPALIMKIYQILDGLNLVKSRLKEKGLFGAIIFHYQHFKNSASRTK